MNKNRIVLAAAVLALFVTATPAWAQESILIKNGTIVPVVGSPIPNGSLLIRQGKIAQIGTNIQTAPGAQVIDATGMYIYPGMVAPMTAIGVTGYPGAGNDQNEIGVSTPQVDPFDALNPEDETIEVTRIAGVTTVQTSSGSANVLDGKSVILNLEGNLASEMTIRQYAAQIFNTGAKRTNTYPSTLSGTFSMIREKLDKALEYAEKKEAGGKGDQAKESKRDLEMEALVPVVRGEVPAIFVTEDEVTLRNALRIIKEYKLKGIVEASAAVHRFVDQLAAEHVPVLWAGTTTVPGPEEPFDLYYRAAALMAEKGVLFAFDVGGSHTVRNLPMPAALSVANGLSEEQAIKALTINPAKILGIDDTVGSLEVGKTANVVVWTGSPIQMRSRVQQVIINGKVIPLTSFQTRLRDKFERIVQERMKEKR
jgi:imidazolonepropionase-like amidohydrolase